jgi:hypothetical protein
MVDCVYYEQMVETEDQKIFRDYLMNCKTNDLKHIYFDLYVDGKLCEGSQLNYHATIDDFVNPTYNLYEMVRIINCEYIEVRGGSSAFASSSSHYNNNLFIYALLIKCISDQEYNLWEQKFEAKFKNKYIFKNQELLPRIKNN